ncbi:unnamed protein product [Microthlaspi erraticum]|uniref:Cystatin domain-containing protein n=1 Tax=Microthlaspi erraticum TaxID=1685480 RepID=A0A6D2JTM6_9BRAS|nr:unnamed protein product [Microthlaspi erraticum]
MFFICYSTYGSMSLFEELCPYLASAYYLGTPDDFERENYPYITRTEKDEPQYTIEQEISIQTNKSKKASPVDLNGHSFVKEPETSGDLLGRLSRKSLEGYNEEENTKYGFGKVVKANFHSVNGYMFFITFEVMDPYDNLPKLFQTRVHYSSHRPSTYYFCRPKPDLKVFVPLFLENMSHPGLNY